MRKSRGSRRVVFVARRAAPSLSRHERLYRDGICRVLGRGSVTCFTRQISVITSLLLLVFVVMAVCACVRTCKLDGLCSLRQYGGASMKRFVLERRRQQIKRQCDAAKNDGDDDPESYDLLRYFLWHCVLLLAAHGNGPTDQSLCSVYATEATRLRL